MKRILSLLDTLLFGFLALLMLAIVVDVSWQVATRFLMTHPSSFTEELAGFLLIWIGILGSAYAFRLKAHLGLDLLTSKLQGTSARRVEFVSLAVCLLFALVVMVIGGTRLVLLTLELNQVSASLGIKMGYIYLALPVSGLLICFYSWVFMLDNLSGNTTPAPNAQ